MRWGRTALCSLVVVAAALFGIAPAVARADSGGFPEAAARANTTAVPALTLNAQTALVTPSNPWFNVSFGVSAAEGPASGLHVSATFYSRTNSASQLQQAINASPSGSVLLRESDLPVTTSSGGLAASTCVTVIPDERVTPPTSGANACSSGSETLSLGCRPLTGTCGDVYPVSVALFHEGSNTPITRFTTFLTYQEPGEVGTGGALRVGMVLPVSGPRAGTVVAALSQHRDIVTTLAVNPATVEQLGRSNSKGGAHVLSELAALDGQQLLDQPYVPIDVAALSEAGIASEIRAQTEQGQTVLHAAGLRPASGPWVDTTSVFAQGDATDLAAGLQEAGASQLVLNDGNLNTSGLSNYTFAQPFTLDLGHGSNVTALTSDSQLSARFTADTSNPNLDAEQLLAGLSFVHFEDPYLTDARGIVIVPPAGWQPSATFLGTLLGGISGNPALQTVTLTQLLAQVPAGGGPGNREPTVRHLQAGPATHGISHAAAVKIAQARQQLSSYTDAISGHVPTEMVALSDTLLGTEAQGFGASRRAAVLTSYQRAFAAQTAKISLAGQETITFTAQQASIPITVLSSAPYPVNVVVTLASDKFTFPNGNTRRLVLDRPTTSVRVTAKARTSGDRLPIDVSLHTPNGQLLLAHTVLTVHSTAISFVGVALTVLAGAVLLVWWARTWRKSRRQRPRAR